MRKVANHCRKFAILRAANCLDLRPSEAKPNEYCAAIDEMTSPLKLGKETLMKGILHDSTDVVVPLAGHHRKFRNYHPLRPGGSQDWLAIYTKEGEGFCHANNSTIRLLPGDLILIEPGRPHDYGLPNDVQKWDLFWVHFVARPDWRFLMEAMPENTSGYRVLRIAPKVRPLVVKTFVEMIRSATAHTPFHDLSAMHQIERLFLTLHESSFQKSAPVIDHRILRATRHIQASLNLPLGLDDIAAKVGISKFRLAHLFRVQMGVTPHNFIMTQRMTRACYLLKTTTHTIAEIASQTGFSNQGHFSYQFKRRLRCSPTSFRSKLPLASKYDTASGKWIKGS